MHTRQNNYDEYIPVKDMEGKSLNRMWIDGQLVEVLPSAQRLLPNRLRVPYSYLSRCPDDLVAKNLNYQLEQERKSRETFFCRFAGNGRQLHALFTERYMAIDHMEIPQAMLEYSCSESSLRLSNGRIAMDGFSGSLGGSVSDSASS